MSEELVVREERAADRAEVHALNAAAFGSADEAELVEELRDREAVVVALVAEDAGRVVGHIVFSEVSFEQVEIGLRGVGLAPMAVLPERQRAGIGSALVRQGLARCGALGFDLAVVLGHPHYYPRFGFAPGHEIGLDCEFEAPPEAFMALELKAGAARRVAGIVRYHSIFSER